MSTKLKLSAPEGGIYEIIVTKAHRGSFSCESSEKYYSGDIYFVLPDGEGTQIGVNKHSLRLRKTFWCVPEDIEADSRARQAEYIRYLPALNRYNEYLTTTGKRYELEREKNNRLPLLPKVSSGA